MSTHVTYLLDTNAISDLMKAAPRIENWMPLSTEGIAWLRVDLSLNASGRGVPSGPPGPYTAPL